MPQVGVVLQRALAISLAYCVGALLLWTRGTYLLVRMGQDPQIAAAAGSFTVALGPALVLDAADQCCRSVGAEVVFLCSRVLLGCADVHVGDGRNAFSFAVGVLLWSLLWSLQQERSRVWKRLHCGVKAGAGSGCSRPVLQVQWG